MKLSQQIKAQLNWLAPPGSPSHDLNLSCVGESKHGLIYEAAFFDQPSALYGKIRCQSTVVSDHLRAISTQKILFDTAKNIHPPFQGSYF